MANNGNRGKFSDRIKKIRLDRLRRQRKFTLEDSEVMYKNFLKVVAVIPIMVAENIFDKPKEETKQTNNAVDSSLNDSVQALDNQVYYFRKKKINREKIEEINVSLIKKRQSEYFKNNDIYNKSIKKETIINNSIGNTEKPSIDSLNPKIEQTNYVIDKILTNDNPAKSLEKKIIDLIKKDLTKIVNELEILESELYVINEINNDDRTLEECRKNLAEVRKILARIEELKQKYDFLKDNFDFEYLLESDNNELIDNVIHLRDMFGNNEVKATVEDYKLLEEYKSLYLKIDKIHENTYKLEEERKKKEEELKDRDIDFNKLKENVYNVNRANDNYNFFVSQQDKLLKELSEKISKINSYESVTYRLKGFGKYLFNSFKYMGLLMMSPLRGFMPSIATQTIITGNVVNNLRKGLMWEENRRMVYEAVDYSGTIYNAINDLDLTDRMVDATLDDLIKFKMEYNEKFKKYHGDFLEYREVIDKINSLQEKMLGNKIKIEIMKTRMKQYEKENENKLKLVRKLNDNEVNKTS